MERIIIIIILMIQFDSIAVVETPEQVVNIIIRLYRCRK